MSMFYELMMKKKGLPSRYQEVEYIESTGTQYIDTGITPSATMQYQIKYSISQIGNIVIFGSRTSGAYNTSRNQIYLNASNYSNTKLYNLYGTNDLNLNIAPTVNTVVETPIMQNENAVIEGATSPIYLFALNNVGTTQGFLTGNIYYFKIYDNNRLVRNFIPVYDTLTQKYGMWESVQGKFYGNDGTGDFGGSIVGYTIVGSPTITDGVVSGFSSSNYLQTSSVYATDNMNNDDYEFGIKLTPTSSMSSECYAIKYYNNSTVRGIGIHNNKFIWSVGQPNTTGHQVSIVSSFNVTTNTTYWLKGIYKNKIASLYYSLDGTNYTLIESIDETDQTFKITSAFNFGATAGSSYGLFLGSIDMKETYIKINNKLWFNGQQE